MHFTVSKVIICVALCCVSIAHSKRVRRIVGGTMAAAPPPDDPVVFTKLYSRNARIEGYRNVVSGLYSFLGLRFAHPPIGNDRFRRPRFMRLDGDINATVYGQPCPQPDSEGYIVGSEDCLWLNIFTPQMPDESTGLPVVFWIHGGGYRYGSANQYTADSLTSKGVIFVPIQYRLGSLGILGDGTTEFSGNAALFDMAAALRWVHEYIQFFGGDPNQITVMGQGSGATAATYLTTTQRTSREMVSGVEIKNIEKVFSSTTKFLDSLVDSVKGGGLLKSVMGKLLPGIDKTLSLTEYLKVSDKLNVMQVVGKLVEATTDALFNLPAILTAQTWTKVAPAYLYSFEHVGESSHRGSSFLSGLPIVGNSKSNNTVAHGDELAYLFDPRDIYGNRLNDSKLLNGADSKVRDIFSNLITKFAYLNGGRGAKNEGAFQEFTSDQSNFIRIGQETKNNKDFRCFTAEHNHLSMCCKQYSKSADF